jgi:hypothetical protein
MANTQIIETSKAILIIRELKILIMKDNTLGNIMIIIKIDSNPISTQRHANPILHALRKAQIPPIELKRRNIIPLFLIDDSQIKRQMCLLLNILGVHSCFGTDQQLVKVGLLAYG